MSPWSDSMKRQAVWGRRVVRGRRAVRGSRRSRGRAQVVGVFAGLHGHLRKASLRRQLRVQRTRGTSSGRRSPRTGGQEHNSLFCFVNGKEMVSPQMVTPEREGGGDALMGLPAAERVLCLLRAMGALRVHVGVWGAGLRAVGRPVGSQRWGRHTARAGFGSQSPGDSCGSQTPQLRSPR